MTKYYLIILGLIIGLSAALPALAQDPSFIGIDQVKTIAGGSFYKTGIEDPNLIDTLVGERIAYLLTFIGIIFLAIIIYSGVQWMNAGGNEEQVEKAKKRIKSSIIGVAIVFFSYIITSAVFKFYYDQSGRNYDSHTDRREDLDPVSCNRYRDQVACNGDKNCEWTAVNEELNAYICTGR